MASIHFTINTSQGPNYDGGDGSIGNPHKYKGIEAFLAGDGVDYTSSGADDARITYDPAGTVADSLTQSRAFSTWSYIQIQASAATKHNGAWDDTKARLLCGVYQITTTIQTFIYDMQIYYSGVVSNFSANTPGLFQIERCVCVGAGGSQKFMLCNQDGTTCIARNNIIDSYGSIVFDEAYKNSTLMRCEFNTVANCGTVARTFYATGSFRSNNYYNNTDIYTGTGGKDSDYNAYGTGQQPGGEANSLEIADWTTVFNDAVGADYSLKPGAAVINQADPNLSVPFDILGNSRDATPDMGAFEDQAGQPSTSIAALLSANQRVP